MTVALQQNFLLLLCDLTFSDAKANMLTLTLTADLSGYEASLEMIIRMAHMTIIVG